MAFLQHHQPAVDDKVEHFVSVHPATMVTYQRHLTYQTYKQHCL